MDAAKERGVPFELVRSDAAAVRKAYERPLTLVRPDGFVAWRGDAPDRHEALRILDTARGA